uniref:Uncharacterized protein n=1 Tax=Siphoviridae sp. ctTnV63 TaxID=2825523 RepID=A0A8S5NW05_9CAUD|nr:MAG TPA: hypothetical protein [Siphoviridae sp. ctTnV63]
MTVYEAKVYGKRCNEVFYGLLINHKYFIFAVDGNTINLESDKNYILLKTYKDDWIDFEDCLANDYF